MHLKMSKLQVSWDHLHKDKNIYGYFFHGIRFSSEIDLEVTQSQSGALPLFHCRIRKIEDPRPFQSSPIWESELLLDNGEPQARMYRESGILFMDLPRVGGFGFVEKGIDVYRNGPVSMSSYFFGRALSLWLELRNVLVLHGSCFTHCQNGYALLGYTGAGKSTLGAYLASRGNALIAEDVCPLHLHRDVRIFRGLPQVRLWADSGKAIMDEFEQYPKIHSYTEKRKIDFSRQHSFFSPLASVTLKGIFVLVRKKEKGVLPDIRPMAPAESLVELVRQSFGAGPVHALGLHAKRLSELAKLVERVPVFQLTYNSGYDMLPSVRQTLLNHIERL